MAAQVAWVRRGLMVALVVAVGVSTGCTAVVFPTNIEPAGNDGSDNQQVTVRFLNLANSEAVHVNFYMSEGPFDVLPDDLFVSGNKVRSSIGVAGSGLIGPGEYDVITVDCEDGMALGTTGGHFVDEESGADRGDGVQRWLQEGAQFTCGAEIVFEYSSLGDGAFNTVLLLSD